MHSHGYIALFIAFLFLTPSFNGIQWSRNASNPFSYDIGMAIEKIGDDYIAIVKSWNVIANEWYCRIIKLNENGRKEWERRFVSDDSECGICISHGIVVLYSHDGKVNLMKMDENGRQQWNKSYSFSFPAHSSRYIIESNGKTIFCVYGFDVERKSIVIKIDGNGSIVWEKRFNHSVSIAKLRNGYIFVETPLTYSRNYTMIYAYDSNDGLLWKRKIDGIGYFVHTAINGFILEHGYGRTWIKFDENGRQHWNKTFEKGIAISSCSIAGDGYIMAGAKLVEEIPKEEGILIKLDENGNELWRKTYFMPRYNIGNILLLFNVYFVNAKQCKDGVIAMVEREAYPNAIFVYFPLLFILLAYFSFIKTDVFIVKIKL